MAALWKAAAARRLPLASAVWVPVPWCGMEWPVCDSAPGRTLPHRVTFHRFAVLCRFCRALAGGCSAQGGPGRPAVLLRKVLNFAIEKGAAGAGCICARGTFCCIFSLAHAGHGLRAADAATGIAAMRSGGDFALQNRALTLSHGLQPAPICLRPWPAPVRVQRPRGLAH